MVEEQQFLHHLEEALGQAEVEGKEKREALERLAQDQRQYNTLIRLCGDSRPMENEVLKDSYERTVFSTPPNGNERLDFEFGEVHSTYVDGREIAYREMKVRTEDEEKSVIDILEGNLVLGEYLDEGERKVEVGRISREIDPEDVRKALDKIMTPEFLMRETGITPGDIYLSN